MAALAGVIYNLQGRLVGILAAVATLFLVIGGLQYITAAGDPSEVERARAHSSRPRSATRWRSWRRSS
jgi:hypothetical protein